MGTLIRVFKFRPTRGGGICSLDYATAYCLTTLGELLCVFSPEHGCRKCIKSFDTPKSYKISQKRVIGVFNGRTHCAAFPGLETLPRTPIEERGRKMKKKSKFLTKNLPPGFFRWEIECSHFRSM